MKDVSLTIPLSLRRTSANGTKEKNQRATEHFSFCQEVTQKGLGGEREVPTILGFDWRLQENNLPKTTQVEFMHRLRLLYTSYLPFIVNCSIQRALQCPVRLSHTAVLTHSCPKHTTKFHWPTASGCQKHTICQSERRKGC